MDKQWLPYAFVQILKLGKCIGSCQFCFMIRHNTGLYKYSTGLCRPCNRSTYCSFSGKKKEKLLKPPNVSSENPEVLSDSKHFCSRDNNDDLKLSNQSQMTQSIYKSFESRAGRCAKTLLHRTYMNLKENELLLEEQSTDIRAQTLVQKGEEHLRLSRTASLPADNDCLDKLLSSHYVKKSSRIFVSETNKSSDSGSPTAKEKFNDLMYIKYQYPNPLQAKILAARFPNPEKLLYSALKLAMKADDSCVQRLVVTDHLHKRYWKACLTLSWPKTITVLGLHPERDLAIFGSYLHMCEHLKETGMIYENEDGIWVPMTCDIVLMMLEKLSKYGDSSLGCSRGRGFKIILKQIKDKDCDKANLSNNQTSSISERNITAEDIENKPFGRHLQENVKAKHCQDYAQEYKDEWSPDIVAVCDYSTDSVSQIAMENIENIRIPNSCIRYRNKPRWLCTIHVGWPFPFSVHAEGLSLPAAQRLGYMSVVHKLKLQKLLTDNNSTLSHKSIEHIVLSSTKQRWFKNTRHPSYYKTEVDKFLADAEIFCDASVRGFGAFLKLTSTQKVSWFSEEWDGHKLNVILHNSKQPYLHSLLGELYTLVTAVFTWKHKLRSQRLLCYSDNLTTVSIVNSSVSEPAREDSYKDPIGSLIHILQSTCHEYNITLQVSWLGRQDNQLADSLARRDILAFQAAVPEAAVNKTKAKKLMIRGESLL